MSDKMKENIGNLINGMFETIMDEKKEDTLALLQTLTMEQRQALANKDNSFMILHSIMQIHEAIAYMRGLPLRSSFTIAIVDGSLKHFFSKYMEMVEGPSCSVDKAGFIVAMIEMSIIKNEEYSLYQDYSKVPKMGEKYPDKQAYWSPETILDTKAAKQIYLDWASLKHFKK